ncbi:TOBE-like domain-containing protein [Sphingorhabdus sp.]|uniref:TOBE-like domain-containing protein n=1 Tax=Sphingorhabdus sp. TaxID=1902408 RepID=UPI00333ED5C3
MNLFHGRAHQGEVNLQGIRIASPEHASAQNAKAFAYVRPHDIDVQPYTPQAALGEGKDKGFIAKLDRVIVIGPIARLELIPKSDSRPAGGPLVETLIEAQLPAQQFRELGLQEGDSVLLTPRKARVFVDAGVGI